MCTNLDKSLLLHWSGEESTDISTTAVLKSLVYHPSPLFIPSCMSKWWCKPSKMTKKLSPLCISTVRLPLFWSNCPFGEFGIWTEIKIHRWTWNGIIVNELMTQTTVASVTRSPVSYSPCYYWFLPRRNCHESIKNGIMCFRKRATERLFHWECLQIRLYVTQNVNEV